MCVVNGFCDQCDTLTQQAMPAYVIDKGIASPELLAMCWCQSMPIICLCTVNVKSFLRAGVDLSRSTLSDWIGRCGGGTGTSWPMP